MMSERLRSTPGRHAAALASAAALIALALFTATLASSAGASSHTVRWVGSGPDTAPGAGCGAPGYPSIGAALAASTNGDEIRVCPGVYQEQVVVNRSVILAAAGDVTIAPSLGVRALDVVADHVIVEDIAIDASGVEGQGVRIASAEQVTLRDVSVTATDGSPEQLVGIIDARNVTLSGLTLEGPAAPTSVIAAPQGIRAVNATGLRIEDATLSRLPHHNIDVLASSDVTIDRTRITMAPHEAFDPDGCEGECLYPQAIRFTGVEGATVRHSTITGGLFGVHFFHVDEAGLRQGVSGVIEDNQISGSRMGVLIGRNGRAEVSGNTISGTRFGVAVGLETGAATEARIINNTITNNRVGVVVAWTAEGVVVEGNAIHGNVSPLAVEVTTSTTLDARQNWWGSTDGVSTSNLALTGDISVQLRPFCTDTACSEFRQHRLTTRTAGAGSGSVRTSPAGPGHAAGSSVSVTAIPGPGSTFAGWSDGCSGTSTTTTVTMDRDRTCVARFEVFDPASLQIEIEAEVTANVGSSTTRLDTAGDRGSAGMSVPAGALPAGATLSAAYAPDVATIARQIPPSSGDLVLAFLVVARNPGGGALTGPFAPPVSLEFSIEPGVLPSDARANDVVAAIWTGHAWREVESTAQLHGDGSATVRATSEHLALFGVLHQPNRGTLTPPPAPQGTTATTWGGGLIASLPPAVSYWLTDGGEFVGYVPGAPPFVNEAFIALFPDGMLPAGQPLIVVR